MGGFLASFALNLHASGQQPSSTVNAAPNCLVPKPDWGDMHGQPISAKPHVAKAAKNSTDTITVDVNKPLPRCVAESSNIDNVKPALSDTGMLLGSKDSDTKIGSANCLLAGVINADFTDCSPSDENAKNAKKTTAVLRENLSLEYVILNIVQWSVVQKKPVKQAEWYLYDRHASSWRSWKVSDSLRMLGSDNIGFLAVHFGIDDTCKISYTVKAKAATAQNLADLQQLYSAIATVAGGKIPALPSSKSTTTPATETQLSKVNADLLNLNERAALDNSIITNPSPDAQKKMQDQGIDPTDKNALKAEIGASPDGPLSIGLASIMLSSKDPDIQTIVQRVVDPATIKQAASVDPGVGVYGFATFKGLEKLPYDLTLSGSPTGTPRVFEKGEKDRIANILATVEARPRLQSDSSRLSLQARTVKEDEGHAIGWSIDDAPITCSAAPKSTGTSSDSTAQDHLIGSETRGMNITAHTSAPRDAPRVLLASWNMVRPATGGGNGTVSSSGLPQTSPKPAKQTNPAPTSDSTASNSYKSEQTYHNEGLYWWDVSLGVPILTPKKTVYDASDGTVRKTSTSPVNLYAFFDLFPKKTDLVKLPRINLPTLSVGLPLASQPFNRPAFGSALGFNLFGMRISPFAGVVLLREYRPKTLALGSKATASQLKADISAQRNIRLLISVNFSLKDAASLVKSGAKATSNSSSKSTTKSTTAAGS